MDNIIKKAYLDALPKEPESIEECVELTLKEIERIEPDFFNKEIKKYPRRKFKV